MSGNFVLGAPGAYEFSLEAWVDRYASWRRDAERRLAAGKLEAVHCAEGACLLEEAADKAPAHAREILLDAASPAA